MCSLFDHIPTECPLCRQRARGGLLCEGCLADLDAIERGRAVPRCRRCGLSPLSPLAPCWTCERTPPPFCEVIVAMPYEWPYEVLVAQLKREHKLWMARTLGHLLARAVTASLAGADVRASLPGRPVQRDRASLDAAPRFKLPSPASLPGLIVPVPAARTSLLRRGFNPAGEIARALGARLSLPVQAEALCRVREASKQSGLRRQARLRAVAGAFEVSAEVRGRHVAVVDDVMTTGATSTAIGHALLAAGVSAVTVWAVARRAR
ncbi:MAG: ComF family protein [Burkholderiaceae bacterium]|nr:ComF family protein [Burkholderiaceae bacterium]